MTARFVMSQEPTLARPVILDEEAGVESVVP
jgi:hypothetical protein